MQRTYNIRYFFSPGGGICLWSGDAFTRDTYSYPIEPEMLPLPAETAADINAMTEWYDTSLNWGYPPDPGPWRQDECDRFNHAARALYTRICDELGDGFEVVYEHDDLTEDPDLDTYLKDPKTFRRR